MFKNDSISFPKSDDLDKSNANVFIFAKIALIYKWVVFTFACQILILFGITTNIINIICFVKQGFKEPINVTLIAMAISDIGSLTTLIWTNLSINPAFSALDLPFDPFEVQYLISGMPHATFSCITGWITALVTLERCLCITAPLKIKSIITTRRVSAIVISVFIVIMCSQSPVYVVNKLDWKYVPAKNKTLIGLVYSNKIDRVEPISYVINSVLPFCAFWIIMICTTTLVIQLKNNTTWRKKSANVNQADSISKRNQKVAKMVVMVSTIFIVCFIPVCIIFVCMSINPELNINGENRDLVLMFVGVGVVLECVNSSVNVFVYYYMSTKFREAFRKTFCKQKINKHVVNDSHDNKSMF